MATITGLITWLLCTNLASLGTLTSSQEGLGITSLVALVLIHLTLLNIILLESCWCCLLLRPTEIRVSLRDYLTLRNRILSLVISLFR